MNETYKKVLRKMEAVDPALGDAILKQALKTIGASPDKVTPQQMKQAYDAHLEKVLSKYPKSADVRAVKNMITALNTHEFGRKEEAITAAATAKKLGEGHIREELYAQPNAEEPNLVLNKLKEGHYEEGSVWGLSSVLRFTKVGGAFWSAMNEHDKKVVIRLDDYSQLEDYKAWTISLSARELTITLQSVRYRPFASFPAAFYIRIKVDGDSGAARKVIGTVVDELDRVPYNMNDWAVFEKKTGIPQDTVKRNWGKFL